jgi:hypothetical protein
MPSFSPDDVLKPLLVTLAQADALLGLEGISGQRRAKLIKTGRYPMPLDVCGRRVVAVDDIETFVRRAKLTAASDYERRRQQTRAAIEARAARRAERRERGEVDPATAALHRSRS